MSKLQYMDVRVHILHTYFALYGNSIIITSKVCSFTVAARSSLPCSCLYPLPLTCRAVCGEDGRRRVPVHVRVPGQRPQAGAHAPHWQVLPHSHTRFESRPYSVKTTSAAVATVVPWIYCSPYRKTQLFSNLKPKHMWCSSYDITNVI